MDRRRFLAVAASAALAAGAPRALRATTARGRPAPGDDRWRWRGPEQCRPGDPRRVALTESAPGHFAAHAAAHRVAVVKSIDAAGVLRVVVPSCEDRCALHGSHFVWIETDDGRVVSDQPRVSGIDGVATLRVAAAAARRPLILLVQCRDFGLWAWPL